MGRSKKNWDHLVNLDGTYGIDIKNGIWPGSALARKGEPGEPGDPGEKGHRGFRGPKGSKGEEGTAGGVGGIGPKGDSAYQVALDEGFTGTEAEWIESLKGETGSTGNTGGDAYDVYYNTTSDNPKLTEAEWLESLKGEKGEQGVQGIKGEASGIFKFQGQLPTLGDIQALDPNGLEPGDVYQDASTDDLYVWDGTTWVLLTEALEVVKGQKGDEGAQGDKGDEGAVGQDGDDGESAYELAVKGGFTGDESAWLESLKGGEGTKGDRGDSAYEIAVKGGFGGTPDEWVESLKGEQGDQGDEGPGAYEYYFNNTSDQPPLTEGEWLDSMKGEKGDNYDPLVLDDYYTSDEVDDLLSLIPAPGAGNNINEMPDENVFEPGDTLNLLNPDQNGAEYNAGIVTAELGTTIVGGPDSVVAPVTITNTVIKDETGLRGPDYAVFQELVEVKSGGASYTRTAVPGQNQFGDWAEASFDSGSYYTKSETDLLVEGVEATLSHEAGAVKLTQSNSGETIVKLQGIGGIAISSGANGIVIDGTALTPTPQFLGILQDGDDPGAKQATPTDGEYFLYGYTGTTVGTDPADQDCTPGDWCIYNTDKWVHLDVSSDSGVVDVNVNGGLLSVDKTNPEQPDIGLDLDDIINDTNLDDYAKKEYVDALELGDLADVNASGAAEGNSLVYDSVKGEWVPGAAIGDYLPLAGGTMKGDLDLGDNDLLHEGFKYINFKSSGPELRTTAGSSLRWYTGGGNLDQGGATVAKWSGAGIEMVSGKSIKLTTEGTADDHVVTKAYVDAKAAEVSVQKPFLGAVTNMFDDTTGTFPDATIDATKLGEADNSYTWKASGQLVISTRGKSKDFENPAFDIDWDRVAVGDKLVFATPSYSRYTIIDVRSITMNTGGTAANITYALSTIEGTLAYQTTKYNTFHFPAEREESEIVELISKLANGVLYKSGDQSYTGTLTFNGGDFKIDRSGGDYSITAGVNALTPFIAVEDNEVLTLGGFKAHEEARGGFLELSGGEMTGDIKMDGNRIQKLGNPTDDADAANKKYVDDIRDLIQILPGNPVNPEVGSCWYSTNQNTFVIRIA